MGFWNDGIRSPSPSRRQHSSQSRTSASRAANSSSAANFFGLGGSSSSGRSRGYSSRARPREGLMAKLRKFLRDLYYYLRKNPLKVFMLVIMPLITGGALTKILGQFGVRLPPGLMQMVGGGGGRGGGRPGDRYYSRGGARDFAGGSNLPGMMSGGGIGESISGALNIAKMFM